MPIKLYSLFLIIIPAVASLILFLRIKKNQILVTRFFFWHYAIGFLILSFVHITIFFINLGFKISYNALLTLNSISLVALLFSYLLFYRGTILLLTKERFITTVFPVLTLPFIATMAVASLFLLKLETITIYTALAWGFLLPNNTYLASLFLYFFIKGAPFDNMKRRPGVLLLSLGWFLVLSSDILLWVDAVTYHPELWIIKIASLKGELLLRAFAYSLILIGALFYGKRLTSFKNPSKIGPGE